MEVSSFEVRCTGGDVEQDGLVSDEIVVLDLDSGAALESPGPDRVPLREVRVRWWVIPVVAVAVAVLAVGLTRAWDSDHTRRARQAIVSLQVSVAPDAELNGGPEGAGAGARYSTTLRVINVGPLPLTVDAVVTTAGGLSLSGSALNSLVPPGVTQDLQVQLLQECRRWLGTEPNVPLELRLEVTTADGVRRSQVSYLATRDTPWRDELEANCRT